MLSQALVVSLCLFISYIVGLVDDTLCVTVTVISRSINCNIYPYNLTIVVLPLSSAQLKKVPWQEAIIDTIIMAFYKTNKAKAFFSRLLFQFSARKKWNNSICLFWSYCALTPTARFYRHVHGLLLPPTRGGVDAGNSNTDDSSAATYELGNAIFEGVATRIRG